MKDYLDFIDLFIAALERCTIQAFGWSEGNLENIYRAAE
jgi:hypothetical protein